MRCGHCHQNHANKDEVFICGSQHGWRSAPRVTTVVEEAPQRPLWGWNDKVRNVKPSETRREEQRESDIALINRLGSTIPTGSYALPNPAGAENDLSFFAIERPERGKWTGKTFVKRQLGPNLERMSIPQQADAIRRIASDPKGASALYGHKVGRCGVCNLPLTNEKSREYGIGPVCRKNNGWD